MADYEINPFETKEDFSKEEEFLIRLPAIIKSGMDLLERGETIPNIEKVIMDLTNSEIEKETVMVIINKEYHFNILLRFGLSLLELVLVLALAKRDKFSLYSRICSASCCITVSRFSLAIIFTNK